jgi:hypothetical protein
MSTELYSRVKDACVTRVQGLNLSRIGNRAYSQTEPQPEAVPLWPAAMITSEGERIEPMPGSTQHRDYWLPVRLFLADRDTALRNVREEEWLTWHRTTFDAFDQKRLAGVSEVQWCQAVPQVTYDPEAAAYRYVVGSMLLKFWVRLART